MKKIHILLKLFIPVSIIFSALLICIMFRNNYYGIMINSSKVPAFELLNQEGRVFTDADMNGKYSFVFFGFLRCVSVCPVSMNVLHTLSREISDPKVQFLYISIDSERDRKDDIKAYISSFGDRFTALYGNETSARKAASLFNVSYEKEMFFSFKSNYQLHHTGSIFLVDPSGQIRIVYPYANPMPDQMKKDFYKLVRSP